MTRGIYRTVRSELGECARINWGSNPACFLTKDSYEAGRYEPPFDELRTAEQYRSDIGGKPSGDEA